MYYVFNCIFTSNYINIWIYHILRESILIYVKYQLLQI